MTSAGFSYWRLVDEIFYRHIITWLIDVDGQNRLWIFSYFIAIVLWQFLSTKIRINLESCEIWGNCHRGVLIFHLHNQVVVIFIFIVSRIFSTCYNGHLEIVVNIFTTWLQCDKEQFINMSLLSSHPCWPHHVCGCLQRQQLQPHQKCSGLTQEISQVSSAVAFSFFVSLPKLTPPKNKKSRHPHTQCPLSETRSLEQEEKIGGGRLPPVQTL